MAVQEFTGVSTTRSFEEALKDALSQVEDFHRGLSGADRLVVAEVVSINFRLGGVAGLNQLEVKVAVVVA